MIEKLRNLVWDEEGQGMVEYSLIIALIAIALITLGVFSGFTGAIGNVFTKATGEMNTATGNT